MTTLLAFLVAIVLQFLLTALGVWLVMYALSLLSITWAVYIASPWLVVFVVFVIGIAVRMLF